MRTTPVRRPWAARPARLRAVAAALSAALLATAALLALPVQRAAAADLSGFDPGYIISDQNMYDSGSMSVADVQRFLDARGSTCRTASDGTPCLKAVRVDTTARAADTRCPGGYPAATRQSAAEIIVGVARACGINPRVLLVMLQKEQSLVTRTTATATAYRAAMGFGCPDGAPCDERYYGLFNQVFQASWQLRSYAVARMTWHFRPGAENTVRFHPDAACGSAKVFIRNQATASLYNYTPYQPNAAALAAGYGRGDACSAYGNRNFWNYYADWFGAPNGAAPVGVVEAGTATNTTLTVQGWALDPDSSDPVRVRVDVDGVPAHVTADLPRPDIAAAYGRGDRHGFTHTRPASPGPHTVCTHALASDPGPSAPLGCRTVVVPDRAPVGAVDGVSATETTVTVSGWSVDPDTTSPTDVHVYVDGVGTRLVADLPRPDVAAALGLGERHGFSHTATVTPGRHEVCVYGINTVAGPHTLLGCRTVVAQPSQREPFGVVEALTVTNTGVTVSGWTVDPDTTAPTDVHVYVDGRGTRIVADQPRPDVARAFSLGDRHGFSYSQNLTPGRHEVCVYAINTGPGAHTYLRCASIVVPDAAPIGAIDQVSVLKWWVTMSGWTLDPDTTAPIQAHVYVAGRGTALTADVSRPDVAAAFGRGDRHGFTVTVTAPPGTHDVCLYGIGSVPGGANSLIGCRTVTVTEVAPPA